MADFIGGVQGSGKSYYMAHYIYNQYEKFEEVYTNIDEFVYQEVKKLDMSAFKVRISKLYDMQVNQNKSDEDILKEWGTSNTTLYVIDEAHNYFNKKDPIMTWFITYHRHLYIELFLLSQNIQLIHADNRIFNNYYIAYPPVKQFSKKRIRYAQYIGYPLNDKNYEAKMCIGFIIVVIV